MIKSLYKFISPKHQTLFLEYKVKFQPRYGHGQGEPNKYLYSIVNFNRAIYEENLKMFLKFKEVFTNIKDAKIEANESLPTWNNGFLPGLDIVALYAFIQKYKPKTYIEVGSGNSTKVAKKSIVDADLSTKIISIDPYPRAAIDSLADEIIRKPVENSDLSVFETLEKNDIVFIDNSHRSFPNSDVTVCFLEILPRLKPGVIVQIHDVYLPYDYPQFMCDRFYSEQYLLATYLLGGNNNKVEILMPNFFVSEDKSLASLLNPLWEHPNVKNVEQHGGSFWFIIK